MKSRTLLTLSSMALAVMAAGCNEANRNTSPVELVATTAQEVLLIDFENPPAGNIGSILVRAIPKGDTISQFMDVRLINYQVSYTRTDGGTQVPATFVRSTSGILPVGGAAQSLNDFVIVQGQALNQAPFPALLPQNGGRDPETGLEVVKMNAFVEIFGETLGGDRVRASVTIPLWFCYGCTL